MQCGHGVRSQALLKYAWGGRVQNNIRHARVSLQDVATATLRSAQQGANHSANDLAVTTMMIDPGELHGAMKEGIRDAPHLYQSEPSERDRF